MRRPRRAGSHQCGRRRSADQSAEQPNLRKVNPADAPVLILALTSRTLTRGPLYDAASNVLQQRLSQMDGIGQAIIGGAALPAVRVELNPEALSNTALDSRTFERRLLLPMPTVPKARSRTAVATIKSTPTTKQATQLTIGR
jgi:multidrug efflux pump subunit AcrB